MSSSQESNTVDNTETYHGVCKWFSNKKGYGFITITSDNSKGDDVFVHQTKIQPKKSTFRTLHKGEYIEFNLESNDKGVQALNVTGINDGELLCDNNRQHNSNNNNSNNSNNYRTRGRPNTDNR